MLATWWGGGGGGVFSHDAILAPHAFDDNWWFVVNVGD